MPREMMMLRHSIQMQAGSDTADIMVYSEICPPGWKWSADDKTAADFDRALKEVREKGARKLCVRINSPGGDVNQAMAMRGMLMHADFEEISVAIEGMCASAATLIGMLPNVHVTMLEGSEYMIHNPMSGCWGQAKDMESCAVRLRNTEKEVCGIYARRCGREEAEIKGWMDAETWFTAAQAEENGFVDEVISAEPIAASAVAPFAGEGATSPGVTFSYQPGAAGGFNKSASALCVSGEMMAAMRGMYMHIPESIREKEVSNGAPAPTENKIGHKEENRVELNQATLENLREENPDLYAAVMKAGADAEQARIQEIDDLSEPGYEEMAEQAKKDGSTPMDFMKKLAAAKREKKAAEKQKGAEMLEQRKQETAPGSAVPGSAAGDGKTGIDEIEECAKEMAGYGKAMIAGLGAENVGMY